MVNDETQNVRIDIIKVRSRDDERLELGEVLGLFWSKGLFRD